MDKIEKIIFDNNLLQNTDSTTEDESEEESEEEPEEDTSIKKSGTGFISITGSDGQHYVILEVVEFGQDQKGSTSTSLPLKQDNQSSCKKKFN